MLRRLTPLAPRSLALFPHPAACRLLPRPSRAVLLPPSRQPFSTSPYGIKRLRQLEDEANRSPHDASRQLSLLQACNQHKQSHVAVRRFETGNYASDAACVREYLRALGATKMISSLTPAQLAQYAAGSSGAGLHPPAADAMGASAGGGGAFLAERGTQDAPLHVLWSESPRAQLWKMLRLVAVAGITISAFMLLLDEKSIPKGLGIGVEVHPVVGSSKRFTDVVGVDEAKQDLQDIVKYLRSPKQFTRLGGKLPKGCLLTGPPGTGKTLLARAVAGEAGVPFFYMSGSEFEEVFVGVGAKRVRELFAAAKKRSPCIIFIDEIDAIGSHRNPKDQSAMKMTLNQLLVEMDGFQQNSGIVVLAATNFPESLDRALVRPGRFDTRVTVPLPDVQGRRQLLDLYAKPVPIDDNVDLDTIARATPGFSGADISNLVNVAALKASHDEKKKVGMDEFEHACDKIRMGAERKSAVISPENLKLTAYHEGGHALVALKTVGGMPIHKATIMPRGEALGMVSYLPEKDQLNLSRQQILAHLDILMGGRVAEEVIFGRDQVTTGASSDLQQATNMARSMITQWGMSTTLGPMFYQQREVDNLSPATREAVEKEVKHLLVTAEANAKKVLTDHKDELHKLAQGLLKYETLTRAQIDDLLAGKEIKLKSKQERTKEKADLENKGKGDLAKAA